MNEQKYTVLLKKTESQMNLNNLRRLIKNPYLFFSFLRSLRASMKTYDIERTIEKDEMPERFSEILEPEPEEFRRYWKEIDELEDFYEVFDSRWQQLKREGVLGGTAGRLDSKFMYVLIRAMKPETVIETGVRYGSFDAHILAAMDKNGKGTLYSIDLTDAVNKYEIGYLIPDGLRERWELRQGDSKEVLPELLEQIDELNLFLHDSLHSPEHMRAEFSSAYPELADGAILASHDVFMTDTFQTFVDEKNMENTRVNGVGVAVKQKQSGVEKR